MNRNILRPALVRRHSQRSVLVAWVFHDFNKIQPGFELQLEWTDEPVQCRCLRLTWATFLVWALSLLGFSLGLLSYEWMRLCQREFSSGVGFDILFWNLQGQQTQSMNRSRQLFVHVPLACSVPIRADCVSNVDSSWFSGSSWWRVGARGQRGQLFHVVPGFLLSGVQNWTWRLWRWNGRRIPCPRQRNFRATISHTASLSTWTGKVFFKVIKLQWNQILECKMRVLEVVRVCS